MRFLITLVTACLLAVTASAEPFLDRAAPLEKLRTGETRFLQALMAVKGTYDGRIEGDWNGRSLNALGQLVRQELGDETLTMRDVATLAAPFRDALAAGRWAPFVAEEANMSYLIPMSVMVRQPGTAEISFVANDAHILIRTRVGTPQEAQEMHQWVTENALNGDRITRINRPDLVVTSAVLKDRVNSVYVHSQQVGKQVATTLVQWRPQRAAEARLIAASITRGPQRALDLPEGGIINRAIKAAQEAPPSPPAQPEPQEDQIRKSGDFAGTGFYINNTDLVTASALLRACDGLRLDDGTPLVAVDAGRGLGAAVLTSTRRSRHWLTLPDGDAPRLDDRLTAVGYPFYARAYRGIGTTQGRMEGRGGSEAGGQRLALSMLRRAGNLGAPVIDDSNTVVAIVVGRAEDDREPLPEKVTLVAPIRPFSAFLTRNDILHDTRAIPPETSQQTFVQSQAAKAIVPVFCK